MSKKYTNISGQVVFTTIIHVALAEEYDSIDEAMDQILEDAVYELKLSISKDPDETEITNLCYDEVEEGENSNG